MAFLAGVSMILRLPQWSHVPKHAGMCGFRPKHTPGVPCRTAYTI
jgi:hypothetical protein